MSPEPNPGDALLGCGCLILLVPLIALGTFLIITLLGAAVGLE